MSSTTHSLFPRLPYTGSCHCGHIKYIIYLSLPPLPYPRTNPTEYQNSGGHRIYKCNCTICQKAGLLHIRPLDAANDFYIVTPKNPMAEGSGVVRPAKKPGEISWWFCQRCGVRPFTIRGTGYSEEVEFPAALMQRLESRALDGTAGEITAKDAEVTKVEVWRPSKDWRESTDDEGDDNEGASYSSINAVTLDAHNENLDLRELHEKGYIGYMQTLQWVGYDYQEKPYFGGAY